jgi:hypothetical protein
MKKNALSGMRVCNSSRLWQLRNGGGFIFMDSYLKNSIKSNTYIYEARGPQGPETG